MRFFRRKAKSAPRGGGQPCTPDNTRLYAIGDIHGRADLLIELHQQIRQDAAGFNGRKVVVYLGDYIDRGM